MPPVKIRTAPFLFLSLLTTYAQKPVVFPGGVVNAASFVKKGQPTHAVGQRFPSHNSVSTSRAAPGPAHYSYIGSDPDGWTHSVTDQRPAVGAPDYTTYIGSTIEYRVAGITTDAVGNTYIAGTRSFLDVFVTKLDPTGNVVFTATLGGKGNDQANAIALDPAGNIYIAGFTSSLNFPLRNALQNER